MAQVNAEEIINIKGFLILNSIVVLGYFSSEAKSSASIIGPICAFDTKIYKNVCHIFNVSALLILSKKKFNFFHFCSQLPSFLVEYSVKIINSKGR